MDNKLLIFDGSDNSALKIGEVYGDHYNRQWQSISSSGMMFIDFKKQNYYDIVQLKASIKYRKFITDCQTWLDLENNTLKSLNKYEKNVNCSWLLSFNFGSYIKLEFNYINVSSSFLLAIIVFTDKFFICSLIDYNDVFFKNHSLRMNIFKYMMVEVNTQI